MRNAACITEFIYLPNKYFSVALGTARSELSHREDARLLARVPRDGLWNDQLNLTVIGKKMPTKKILTLQSKGVITTNSRTSLVLNYLVTISKSCGSADTPDSAQAEKLPEDPE